VLPLLAVYAASFVNVGIFWSNHHHMMQSVGRVNGGVLWANLALLFWLSLIPFVIRWIDEASMTSWPVAAYGIVLVAAAIAYIILERTLIAAEGDDSKLSLAVGSKFKEWASFACYSAGIAAAFVVSPYVSIALYLTVSAIWLVPDRRFERSL
jgi:uncharacterized membrane protein